MQRILLPVLSIATRDAENIRHVIERHVLSWAPDGSFAGGRIALDFSRVKHLFPVFVNYAIAPLLEHISMQQLRESVQFEGIPCDTHIGDVLDLCLKNAEKYYTDSEYRQSVDKVMAEMEEEADQ